MYSTHIYLLFRPNLQVAVCTRIYSSYAVIPYQIIALKAVDILCRLVDRVLIVKLLMLICDKRVHIYYLSNINNSKTSFIQAPEHTTSLFLTTKLVIYN